MPYSPYVVPVAPIVSGPSAAVPAGSGQLPNAGGVNGTTHAPPTGLDPPTSQNTQETIPRTVNSVALGPGMSELGNDGVGDEYWLTYIGTWMEHQDLNEEFVLNSKI